LHSVGFGGQGGIVKGAAQSAVQLFLNSWSWGPFWADFDLSDRPPVYKTAALPLSYAGVDMKGSGSLLEDESRLKVLPAGTRLALDHGARNPTTAILWAAERR
jgi:hypothetical protein